MKEESIAELRELVDVDSEISRLIVERRVIAKRIHSHIETDDDFRSCIEGNSRFKINGTSIQIDEDWYEYEKSNFINAISINHTPEAVIDLDEE